MDLTVKRSPEGIPEVEFSGPGFTLQVALRETGPATYRDGSFKASLTLDPDGTIRMSSLPPDSPSMALVPYEAIEGGMGPNVLPFRKP